MEADKLTLVLYKLAPEDGKLVQVIYKLALEVDKLALVEVGHI